MKKLMIAASAALCATVGFSDVTSANIVGYLNTDAATSTKSAKYIMLGCAFASIDKNGCDVTDLKFDGYQDIADYIKEKAFSSYIQIINSSGIATSRYVWNDEYDATNTKWLGGYWVDAINGNKRVVKVVTNPDTETTAVIPIGTGLWSNVGYYKKGYMIKLTCAGQVLTGSQAVPASSSTKSAKYIALCNPLARAVDLTEVSFDGYQTIDDYIKEKAFSSYIQIINSSGIATSRYVWNDEYDATNTKWLGGYWVDAINGNKRVVKVVTNPDTETTVSIPAGQGLWCNVGAYKKDHMINLVWPKTLTTAE